MFIDKGFFSTTSDPSILTGMYDKGPLLVQFTVKGKTGTAIESLSQLASEKEVLFNASTPFTVVSSKEIKKGSTRILQVVLQEL